MGIVEVARGLASTSSHKQPSEEEIARAVNNEKLMSPLWKTISR